MLKLRPAINSQSDFEVFLRLHEDQDITQIYKIDDIETPSEEARKEAEHFFSGFDWDSFRYKRENFEYDTSKKYILFIELDGTIIGSFAYFRLLSKQYRLTEWNIVSEFQNLKEEIWNIFIIYFKKRNKKAYELSAYIPSKKSTLTWFKKHGFTEEAYGFCKLYLKSQEGST